jgi:hypothetical protein
MKSSYLVPLLCAAAIAFACGPRPHSGEAAATATAATPAVPKSRASHDSHAPAIASSLDVSVKDGVGFVFHVTNNSSKAIELTFPSGQTHDFAILDASGREVWRWSGDRMFTQALRNTVLDAGETKSYDGRWEAAGQRGTFTAVATLKSTNHPVETRVEFTVP